MPSLPPAYLARMQTLLGDEYPAFLASYDVPPDPGLRVNTLKLSPETFQTISPFPLDPLPWTRAGFRLPDVNARPGLHPYHAAGLYYLQEPSAQAVAEILDPQPGERILDLAAAPGGKTTHLAAKMQNQGCLLANEIHPKRVWDLVKNLERWGARNVVVTQETPARLAAALPAFFDRVLVDAPCSGEGMFRKAPETIRDWSPEFVAGCALRQTAILDAAAQLVRPGGWLCYATCTFAPEENEHVISRFLNAHPTFSLAPASPPPFPLSHNPLRLYPHRAPGEGHFIALLRHKPTNQPANNQSPIANYRITNRKLLPLWTSFSHETLNLNLSPAHLRLIKSYLYAVPPEAPPLAGLKTVRAGWWLGSFKKDRFEPSHALAMALRPEEVQRLLPLDETASESAVSALAYLQRATLRFDPARYPDGWTLVTIHTPVGRFPLGWGKMVKGVLKNHLPAGLRTMG